MKAEAEMTRELECGVNVDIILQDGRHPQQLLSSMHLVMPLTEVSPGRQAQYFQSKRFFIPE